MNRRLGIAVSARVVNAVVVSNARVQWQGAIELRATEGIGDGLVRLLAEVPRGRVGFSHACVALGLCYSQLKVIEGLPPAKNLRVLSELVRGNSSSFFLRNASRHLVTNVVVGPNNSVWAAAFDQGVVLELLAVLRTHGMKRVVFSPTLAALASVLPAGVHSHVEEDLGVAFVNGGASLLDHVTRIHSVGLVAAPPNVPAALGECGLAEAAMIAAYGAALSTSRAPFAWRPEPDAKRSAAAGKLRIAVLSALAACALVTATAAPGLRAAATLRRDSRAGNALMDVHANQASVQEGLRQTTAALDHVARFGATRGAVTLLIASIAQAIPESTAVVSIRVDSVEGSMVALSPHVLDVLPQLEGVDGVIAPRMVGSLTRETVGNVRVERGTIRFRRPRLTPAQPVRPSGLTVARP